MNSENESTSFLQKCSNFAKANWKLYLLIISLTSGIAYAGYWVGKNDTERKYSDQVNELNSKIMQHENTRENLSRENERLQGSKEIINKKDAEIKKLTKELLIEHKKSDCYKNINAQINQLKEEKRKTKGLGISYGEKKKERDAKIKDGLDKLDAHLAVFFKQLGECKN
jgi:chromosome segregation ATPase